MYEGLPFLDLHILKYNFIHHMVVAINSKSILVNRFVCCLFYMWGFCIVRKDVAIVSTDLANKGFSHTEYLLKIRVYRESSV